MAKFDKVQVALILTYLVFTLPYAILLMTGFLNTLPRELQDRFDTRRLADRLGEAAADSVGPEFAAFIQARDMFFLATADADGAPDCSYKGGMPGFVRVVDDTTLARQPQVQAAAAQLRQAYLNLQRGAIVSPISGYVARRSVQLGQRVQPGDLIGTVGARGESGVYDSQPHLHFEIRRSDAINGKYGDALDPLLILPKRRNQDNV